MLEHEYAKAIFELAIEQGLTLEVKKELDAINELLNDNDFNRFMNSLSIKIEDKKKVIQKSLNDFSELTIDFICVLLDNRRFNLFVDINKEFNKILLEKSNNIKVKLYSTKALSDLQIERLKPSIINRLNNKNIIIENIVDESLIGGIVIYANDEKIDLSTKNSLEKLKASL